MGKIYKVTVSKQEIKLPQETNDKLSKNLENKLNIKIKNRESFEKMNEVAEIIDTPEIRVTGQKTNIFLLNLFLLTSNVTRKDILEQNYNNHTLIQCLEDMTKLQLKGLEFKLLEKKVESYLIKINKKDQPEENKQEVEKEESVLDKVEYNLSWLRKAHKEIEKKRREKHK